MVTAQQAQPTVTTQPLCRNDPGHGPVRANGLCRRCYDHDAQAKRTAAAAVRKAVYRQALWARPSAIPTHCNRCGSTWLYRDEANDVACVPCGNRIYVTTEREPIPIGDE